MKLRSRYKKGDRIGNRYQVHQALLGGMGEVYLCLDLEGMHPYALKTFQQSYQTQALCQAFEMEVAIWVGLEKHPNIVRCFHMDTLDNQPFMVLDWVVGERGKGTDLRSWLQQGPLAMKLALEITIDICRGLQHAQQKQPGLVHRDLKPENILIAQGGMARVTDFGLAQIVAKAKLDTVNREAEGDWNGPQSLVQAGGAVGTPAYMPPEQWRGELLDVRTDIYAVGCILYEMLSGQMPFQLGFSPRTREEVDRWLGQMQALHKQGNRPELSDQLPTSLRSLVQHCLRRDPAERPDSLETMLANMTQLYWQAFGQTPPERPEPGKFTAGDYNNRGNTYLALGQNDRALADYQQTIQLDPQDATAYTNRGVTYSKIGQFDRSLADYDQALQLNPQYADAYFNRGNTYYKLQQHQLALADYSRVLNLDPTDSAIYNQRGIIYSELQQHQLALSEFNQAIDLDPKLARSYLLRGLLYQDLQQHQLALADFNRAIELDTEDKAAYFLRGKTYSELQQHQLALADFNRAIGLDAEYIDAYFNRGRTYLVLEQYQLALVDFNRAIDLDPEDYGAYVFRGNIYRELQQHQLTLADFNRAIELHPEEAISYLQLGVVLMDTGQLRESLSYLEKALQMGLDEARDLLAVVRQALKGPVTTAETHQAAFESFLQVASQADITEAVVNFPIMIEPIFIAALEEAIDQGVPPEEQSTFQKRLTWLRQIAKENNQ